MVEYVRLDEANPNGKKRLRFSMPASFVLPLIAINALFFFMQMLLPGFTDLFVMRHLDLFNRPWTLLTSMFLHSTPTHLLFNMYGLFLFGSLLERKIGPKRFLLIYMLSGLIVALFSNFIYSSVLGASGAVMGIIGSTIIFLPRLKLLFFFVLPLELWVAGIGWFFIDFFGIFMNNNVANEAHIIGLIFGLAYGYYLLRKRRKFHKKFSSKKHMTLEEAKEYKKKF